MASRFTEHFDDELYLIHDLCYLQAKSMQLTNTTTNTTTATASNSSITANHHISNVPLCLIASTNSTFTANLHQSIVRKRSLCNTFDSLSTFTTSSSFNYFTRKTRHSKQERNNSQCTLKRQNRVRTRQFKKSKIAYEASDHQLSVTPSGSFVSLEHQKHQKSDAFLFDSINHPIKQSVPHSRTMQFSEPNTSHNAIKNWCIKQKTKFVRLRQIIFV
ncbi:hypothetical protein BDF20DRAFT_883056 [Mycotypha africana]|uniref:uncharacterized protein n=1 Tax=Mycotypha africana TaxID=64632 RepID=UPI0023016BCA|nr:uncharacterized protein BDF20DRAFT_883056 [Mycotypha africana]KAI8973559.1 hypothetical protein BDF20DRAFT_883056 [Mycotypha africana]